MKYGWTNTRESLLADRLEARSLESGSQSSVSDRAELEVAPDECNPLTVIGAVEADEAGDTGEAER